GLAIGVYLLRVRRDGLAAAILAYGCLAVSLNYPAIWVHVGSGERGTYELFLLLLIALVTTPRDLPLARPLGAGVAIAALAYLWIGSVDAGLVRYAVMG